MPKGKIEALTMAIRETNLKLEQALANVAAQLSPAVKSAQPIGCEDMITLLGAVNAALALTRSNQAQLQTMLEEAFAKGV